jgi:hypothetical protein
MMSEVYEEVEEGEEGAESEHEPQVLVKPSMTIQEKREAIARMHERALEAARISRLSRPKKQRKEQIDPSTLPVGTSEGMDARV